MNGMDRKIEKKNTFTRKTLWYIMGGVLVLVVAGTMIFGDKSSRYNIDADRLTIETVKRDIFQNYINVQGNVEPIKTIYLDAVEGGRVEEILIDEGNMVNRGDVILRLSNNNLLLEITNNEAQVVRAVNELRTARLLMDQQKLANKQQIIELSTKVIQQKRMFENNKQLVQQNHISKEDFEQSREAYETSLAQLKLVKENYHNDS